MRIPLDTTRSTSPHLTRNPAANVLILDPARLVRHDTAFELREGIRDRTRDRSTVRTWAMAVRRIVPDLHADDPAASREFYVEVLGLDVVMDQGWIVTYAVPDGGGAAPQISVMGDDASAPVRPDVSIEVDDVDAVHATAVRLGYEIVHPLTDEPWGVRRFFVRDRDGAVVNVLGHR